MRLAFTLSILAVALLSGGAVADDKRANQPMPPYDSKPKDSAKPAVQRTAFVPCVGRGYVPYSYPAVDSCPCGSDCCYHPWRYYCGGKSYKKQWYKTWLRAHFGKGSMLDQYPCRCRFPTAGRTYLSWPSVAPMTKPVPPAPDEKQQ